MARLGSDSPDDRTGLIHRCSRPRRPAYPAIPIAVMTWPIEATRTPNSACVWIAEATIEGRTYTARSRHGAANALSRQLVVAGVVDRPMVIRYHGLAGTMTYRSFHAAAKWTFGEGERMLRRVRYRQPPEGVFLGSGTGKKCVSSPMADDMESLAANRRKAEAPPPAIETRRCDGCDADFRPGRPWSRFCCPACRLWAHRRLAGVTGAQELATIFKSDPR